MRLHRLALSTVVTIAALASACSKAADTSDTAAAASSGGASPVPGGGIDAARLGQHVAVLAADSFMGRGPATAGEEKAVAYISAQMGHVDSQQLHKTDAKWIAGGDAGRARAMLEAAMSG